MTADDRELKKLQRQCSRALALYLDCSEAVCEILTSSATAPLSPADRARVRTIHRQEMGALKAYLVARLGLMTALSFESDPDFRHLCAAAGAAERKPFGARA